MVSLDETWFERIKNIHDGIPARLVVRGYKSAREAFFSSAAEYPKFRYEMNNDKANKDKLQKLNELEDNIISCGHTNQIVKNLYLAKIQEKRKAIELLSMSFHLTTSSAPQQYADSFMEIAYDIFGKLDADIFSHACKVLYHEILEHNISSRQQPFADLLKGQVTKHTSVSDLSIEPSIETGEFIEDVSQIEKVIYQALEEAGISDWEILRGNTTRSGFAVKPSTKVIVMPNQRILRTRRSNNKLTEGSLAGVIEHEMTHIIRCENGLASPLKLLGVGLAGYLVGEEGLATYRQQMMVGAKDYVGGLGYVTAGLIAGLDRETGGRNFREVYNLLNQYYEIVEPGAGQIAQNLAFRMCTQLFKGTHGERPGVFLPLQASYRKGNIAIHNLLKEEPEIYSYALIGKFDLCSHAHREALVGLGIMPPQFA